jgi:hypothetical protein
MIAAILVGFQADNDVKENFGGGTCQNLAGSLSKYVSAEAESTMVYPEDDSQEWDATWQESEAYAMVESLRRGGQKSFGLCHRAVA